MTERLFEVHSDCVSVKQSPFEMHDAIKYGNASCLGRRVEVDSSTQDMVNNIILEAPKWLPFAAEKYQISPNISDYICIPVPIMPSDLPNRNNVAFPFTELTAFNTDCGCLSYQTWKGMPAHVEHQNKDYTKAKGVILDTVMRPLTGFKGNLWKVINLMAFDRTKDPVLVNEILTHKRNSYSMGAFCADYRCSICGASLRDQGGCVHLNKGDPTYKIYDGKLACWNIVDMKGYETSSVAVPAYVSAINDNVTPMWSM